MCKKSLLMMLLLALLVPWAANAQKALPYSYGFENNDLDAEGWTVQKTSSSTGISTSAKHEGSYGFQFVYSEQNAYLVSPVLSGTESGVALSFYYKEYSSSYGDEQFYVGYTTDETVTDPSAFTYGDITTASLAWQLYETMLPAGTKKVAIKYVYNDAFYLFLDDFTFEAPSACPKPTDLSFALTPGNGTVATLSWTENGTASEWQICLNGDETNLIAATTNPWQLTGLTPETTYTAKVRANCGSEQSAWSNEVTFKPTNAYQITVNDGTTTNGYVPIYGYYVDNISKSQFIIPAENLADMAWGTINKMTFYAAADKNWGNAQFEVYMTETDETTISELVDYTTMTKVKNAGSLSISGNQMVVQFDTHYSYMGGNLMIGFLQTVTGTYSSCSWYGVSATGASMGGYGTSITQQNFLPKTTFDYIPGEAPACMWPTHLAVSNVTAHTAELSWTSDGNAWQIGYSTDGFVTEQYVDVTENPYTLTGLDPETDYEVRVQTNCGDGIYSVFCTPVSFTTEPSCYAPTDMVISDITAYSANVAWTSDNTNFDMRYTTDLDPNNDFETSNLRGWTNIDADGDGYEWVLGSACGGIYLAEGGSLAGAGHNSSADMVTSGSYSNFIADALTPDNYLVSPQITLGGSISFWACAQDGSYAAEHFGVAVSTTGNTDAADFTTIAEWTIGSRSANVLRSSNAPRGGNRAQSEWVLYTVDLSAYSGRGYVAIRHFNCTDMFMLNVDDIVVEQPGGFQVNWTDVPNPTNPQALTNLDDATLYVVQVRANCGAEDGYSPWLEGSFTTLPACMVPTGLVVSNIDKRSADIAWVSNGDEEAWQICVNGDEENLIYVTDTAYTLTDLLPDQTRYIVKVRAYCDEQLQSAWSSPVTFYTLIACPAPTNLFISDIANISAVANWTGEGDFELQYGEDVWKHYDNGVFATSMGAGGTIYWGMMLPAESLTAGEPLTNVVLHTSYAGEATLNVYLGGDQPTGTPAATQTFTMAGDGDFMEITLDTPVAIDGTQNLWITFYQSGLTYPADGCTGPTDPNGRWVSLDGETWADIAGYGYDFTWMIRAAFGNNTQTEWVTIDNATSPQAITGLNPETNYYVRVKHICGGIDGESVWVTTSFTTDIACPAPEALGATPYALSAELSWEGISESYTVRYGIDEIDETLYSEDFAEGIPADWTNDATYPWEVVDGYIKSTNAGVGSSSSTISFTMTVSADAYFEFDAQCMGEGTSSIWDKCMFTLDGTTMFTKGANGDQWDHYSFPITAGEHTFTWSYSKDSSVNPTGDYMAVDNIAIVTSHIVWNTVTAETNEYLLTGLTPLTTYHVQVMGDCGDFGTSEWSEIITFTTTEDTCPVPTNLTVDTETLTATTADLSWNGSPDVESFTVRYRAPQHATEGSLYETFGTTIPTGWTMYTGLLSTVMEDPTALTANTYAWSFGTNNGVFDNHARVNIYGTYQRWLVTPEVTVAAGANLAFDMALTVYTSGSNASPTPGNQADDKFIVLISTDSLQTWTILRQWDNQGSGYVYDEITNDANGQPVSIDLSAYVGQTVHIAFYGESTASGGDNNLHIDNVIIGEVIPATDWQTVTTSDMNVTLTGLTPETTYEAQVKADCSDPEAWSNTVNFTTLEQTTLTQTIALAAGSNYVSFYVDITLNDLKAALVATGNTAITIKAKTQSVSYNGRRWNGTLNSLDVAMMYIITVANDCEIAFEGMPLDPAEHPITIVEGASWIGFPFAETMSLTNAFAGFAVNGDKIQSKTASANYTRGRWMGSFTNLVPGQGYIFKSSETLDRIFVYPSNAK